MLLALGVALAPDGTLYVDDPGTNRIRRIAPGGPITTVAGTGVACTPSTDPCGDGGPAVQARLNASQGLLVAADGSLYLTDGGTRRVRRVGTDGVIDTLAGSGNPPGCAVDGVPARSACLGFPFGIVTAPDGSFTFSDSQLHRVFRVGLDGVIHRVAGTGACAAGGDGGLATAAQLCSPEGLTRGGDGSLYVADWANARIRRVDPEGVITTVAGTVAGLSGDGGPATAARIQNPTSVKRGPDGSFYIADVNNHRLRRITPPLPGFTSDDLAIPSEDGREVYQLGPDGRHLRTVDTLTGATRVTFSYDAGGRLAGVVDGDGNATTVQRDGAGTLTGLTSPFGQLTTLGVDAGGFLSLVTDPAGQAHQFVYGPTGLLTRHTNPRGLERVYTYDALGRLVRSDDPAGGFRTLARTEQAAGYEVVVTTALGRTTQHEVTSLAGGGQQRVTVEPDGLPATLVEQPSGANTLTVPAGEAMAESLGPDPRWQMQAPLVATATTTTPGTLARALTRSRAVSLADPANLLSVVTHTETSSVNGRTSTSVFSAGPRTFTGTSPEGRQVLITIDAQGRRTAQQLGTLDPVTYAYDGRGRLASRTAGSGPGARTATYGYAGPGFLATVTDPLGAVTVFAYDAAGRATQQTRPDGQVIGFGYDAGGNLTSVTPPGRPAHTLAYSPLDLVASYTPPAVPGTGPTQYTYNLDGQVASIARADGQAVSVGYDGAGRLATLTTPEGSYTHAYSGTTGQPTGITAPDGGTLAFTHDGSLPTGTTWGGGPVAGSVTFTYDASFRRASRSINGAGPIGFTYDDDDLLTAAGALTLTRQPQTGLITGTTLGSVTDTRGHSGFGEVTGHTTSFNATPLYAVTYAYDKLGRLTQKTETVGGGPTDTFGYAYDGAGRLTGVTRNGVAASTYAYDANGNRLSLTTSGGPVTGAYDAQDRLTTYGPGTYVYNAAGELVSRTVAGPTTTYAYDALGNLRLVTLPGGAQRTYAVDGRSRRISAAGGGPPTRRFLYEDQLRPAAELDGADAVVSRFVYAEGGLAPDYMVQGASTYRLVKDHQGSVRLVVNVADGTVAQRLDYDEFGVVTQDTNPGFQPFGFAGGLYDTETKLTRFGARDYDAETGRWTSRDPVRFAGRSTNLYEYAFGDPVNFHDPSGLFARFCRRIRIRLPFGFEIGFGFGGGDGFFGLDFGLGGFDGLFGLGGSLGFGAGFGGSSSTFGDGGSTVSTSTSYSGAGVGVGFGASFGGHAVGGGVGAGVGSSSSATTVTTEPGGQAQQIQEWLDRERRLREEGRICPCR